jgi:hypothetical protein
VALELVGVIPAPEADAYAGGADWGGTLPLGGGAVAPPSVGPPGPEFPRSLMKTPRLCQSRRCAVTAIVFHKWFFVALEAGSGDNRTIQLFAGHAPVIGCISVVVNGA